MKEERDSIYIAMEQTKGRIQSLTDYPDTAKVECDNRKKNRGVGRYPNHQHTRSFSTPHP
jgi:hypothetical protein